MTTEQAANPAAGATSTVHVFGHPIHPMLVPFPIALLIAGTLTDVLFLVDDDPFWARASLWLIAAGVLSGALAAIVGLVDFLTIERVRRLTSGWIHFLGNAAVLVIALLNWILRIDDQAFVDPWGLVLSIVTTGLLAVTGWTGGELAYRHRVGVIGG